MSIVDWHYSHSGTQDDGAAAILNIFSFMPEDKERELCRSSCLQLDALNLNDTCHLLTNHWPEMVTWHHQPTNPSKEPEFCYVQGTFGKWQSVMIATANVYYKECSFIS